MTKTYKKDKGREIPGPISPTLQSSIESRLRDGLFIEEIAQELGIRPSVVIQFLRELPATEGAELIDDYLLVLGSKLAYAATRDPDKASHYKMAYDAMKHLASKLGDRMSTKVVGSSKSIRITRSPTKLLEAQGTDTVETSTRPKVDYAKIMSRAQTDLMTSGGLEITAAPVEPEELEVEEITPTQTIVSTKEGVILFDQTLPAALRAKGIKLETAPGAMEFEGGVPSDVVKANDSYRDDAYYGIVNMID